MHKNKFVVYFKGIRGSHTVSQKDFMEYGGNTACVYINANNKRIILDAGNGIINAGNQIREERICNQEKKPFSCVILLSHLHFDHIHGLPFFNYLHHPESKINLFCRAKDDKDLEKELSDIVFNKSFPLDIDEIKSAFRLHAINDINNNYAIILKDNEEEPVITTIDEAKNSGENDVVITTLYSKTHPKDGVMIYKITYRGKSVVYATDKECYQGGDKALSLFARDCDLLIHDSQYTQEDYNSVVFIKQGFGHSTFDMAIKEKENSHAKNLAFFHYATNYNDEKLDEIKKDIINKTEGLIFTKENQKFEIL